MSYCPKCGRRIYEEEKGCEFCGVVNDSSHWESTKGMKNQINSLDHQFTEQPEQEDIQVKKEITKSKLLQEDEQEKSAYTKRTREEKTFPGIAKVVLIAMMFIIPWGGFLIGIVLGFLLKNSPEASYRAFGKVLIKITIVCVIIKIAIVLFGVSMFMIPHTSGSIFTI